MLGGVEGGGSKGRTEGKAKGGGGGGELGELPPRRLINYISYK